MIAAGYAARCGLPHEETIFYHNEPDYEDVMRVQGSIAKYGAELIKSNIKQLMMPATTSPTISTHFSIFVELCIVSLLGYMYGAYDNSIQS